MVESYVYKTRGWQPCITSADPPPPPAARTRPTAAGSRDASPAAPWPPTAPARSSGLCQPARGIEPSNLSRPVAHVLLNTHTDVLSQSAGQRSGLSSRAVSTASALRN